MNESMITKAGSFDDKERRYQSNKSGEVGRRHV